MAEKKIIDLMTPQQYLAFEENSSLRHEYVEGRIFAMIGGTLGHNAIVTNLLRAIDKPLQGSGCRAYVADVKVHVQAANSYYYPDLVVSCEAFVPLAQVLEQPVLVIEVLSPSTKHIDRREKLVSYMKLPSLREYVIVYHDRFRADLHRKTKGGWSVSIYGTGDVLTLESLPGGEFHIPIADLYQGLDLPPAVKEEEEEYVTASG